MTSLTGTTTGTPNPVGIAPARIDPRVLVIAGAAAISVSSILIKLADVGPSTAVFFRCFLALPPLAWMAWRECRRLGMPTRRAVILQLFGGILLGVDFALWSQSILMIGAGIASVVVNVQVIVVPALSWLILGNRVPRRFLFALPFLFGGIALAGGVIGGGVAGPDLMWGTVLSLVSGIAYGGYIFMVGFTGASDRAASQVLISTISAGIAGSMIGSLWGRIDFVPGWDAFFWLVALALVGQVFGWVLMGRSLPRLSAEVGATLLLMQPVLAVLLAVLLVGERPSVMQLLGCVVVVGAVSAVSVKRTRAVLA
ncbi:DMT family transporter [Rhodococcus sp. ARC_M6]|uniref:DMT family transporter n=1 Tax=Rhodococcus sp. ARC_M6 TaxID=2928852 RepID=UPI001FB20518|nr:DMT family transporter [Rhodococcus sp. ARC_M6]MCJ0904368.1 DMT family transporter [Rhodococcus sp. ARC_M6]